MIMHNAWADLFSIFDGIGEPEDGNGAVWVVDHLLMRTIQLGEKTCLAGRESSSCLNKFFSCPMTSWDVERSSSLSTADYFNWLCLFLCSLGFLSPLLRLVLRCWNCYVTFIFHLFTSFSRSSIIIGFHWRKISMKIVQFIRMEDLAKNDLTIMLHLSCDCLTNWRSQRQRLWRLRACI